MGEGTERRQRLWGAETSRSRRASAIAAIAVVRKRAPGESKTLSDGGRRPALPRRGTPAKL